MRVLARTYGSRSTEASRRYAQSATGNARRKIMTRPTTAPTTTRTPVPKAFTTVMPIGQGVLMLQRPGESYAIWVFWFGPEREFRGWYVNLQEPFRRTELGYDTQDLELDIWVLASGGWELKDDDVMEERLHEGRFTGEQVAATRAEANRVTDELDAGRRWWSDE
jgi:hypothetical protein